MKKSNKAARIAISLLLVLCLALPTVFAAAEDTAPARVKIPVVEVLAYGDAEATTLIQAGLDIIDVEQDGDIYIFTIMVKDFEKEYFAANDTKYLVIQEDATADVEWLGYEMADGVAKAAADDPQPIPGMPQNGNNVIAQPSLTVNPNAVFDPTGVLFDDKYGFPVRRGYRTVTEYYAESNYLAMAFPDLVKKYVIGRSYENVPMIAIEISSAPGSNDGRPGALIQAGNHAREWPTNELALNTMWYLVTQYGKNDRVTELLDSTTCWFLPATNPDGTNYDQRTSPGSWRKNRRANGGTSYGVDVNRNWPYGWGSNNGSSSSTTSDTYRGTAASSEYEVQAVTSLYESNQIVTSLSGHTSGQLIIYAWGHKFNQPGTNALLAKLGRELADYNLHADQYSESLYAASGDLCDYAYGAVRALHYTVEHYRSFVPNYNGTNMNRGYPSYNDLFQGTQRNFPVTYSTNATGRAPTTDLIAPVGFIDDPDLFRTGYGGPETMMTAAKVNALPADFLAGKIFITPQGSSTTVTRDVILAAQAKGAVGVLFCGASSGNYSGGYAHYTPSWTADTNVRIPVAGTNKGYVRELYERAKAGEPNSLKLTANTENTESMYWQFERQIGAYMHLMDSARVYAAHVKGKITDNKGGLIPEATLNLAVEIDNNLQASNSGTGLAGSPLRYLPLGSMTSTHTSTYNVSGGVYDWSVVPSVQPVLEDYPIPEKPYTITASANGFYDGTKDAMVEWYQDVVDNVNFALQPAVSSTFDFGKAWGPVGTVTVPFSTHSPDGSVGVIDGAAVTATVGGLPVAVNSLGGGNYTATFDPADLNLGTDSAELVINFDGGADHTAFSANIDFACVYVDLGVDNVNYINGDVNYTVSL
ncbi:MAG: M14 family metallopeptidase, partial [Clostridiales bacterium]|nr:M14 family metallopeptidase [Clostridiales bacterium]